MPRRHDLQDASGIHLAESPAGRANFIIKRTAPTNGQAGYQTGCIWINTNGTAGAILYVNQGTPASSTWSAALA